MSEKMLKGPGDFSPEDPEECPDICPYYDYDLGPDNYCSSTRGCVMDPPDPDDYPENLILKGD